MLNARRVARMARPSHACVRGNPAQDIGRPASASAARSSDLPGVTTARIVEDLTAGCEAGLDALDHDDTVAAVGLPARHEGADLKPCRYDERNRQTRSGARPA